MTIELDPKALEAALSTPLVGAFYPGHTAGESEEANWEAHKRVRYTQIITAYLSASPASLPVQGVREERDFETLLAAAKEAVQALDDWTNVNETEFTGWGDGEVPAAAEWWRVKSGQALRALDEIKS